MKESEQLKVEKREVFGRKVKNLRKQGTLPANIYGKKIKSLAVQLPKEDFLDVFEEGGEAELLYLRVKGEKEKRPVLVSNVQIHPVSGEVLHVDFQQVDLSQETTVEVPLKFVGESPAVKEGKGMLLELVNEIQLTCLPTNIPREIEVDISVLKEADQQLMVKDLKLPKNVKTEIDPEEAICKIEPPKATAEEIEEEKQAEAEAEAGAEAEAEKGEEVPAEEKEEESK